MSARLFAEWRAYEIVEPFGERADYWRAGQICAALKNSQRTKTSNPIAKAEDFMPETLTKSSQSEDPSEAGEKIVKVFEGLAELHRAQEAKKP